MYLEIAREILLIHIAHVIFIYFNLNNINIYRISICYYYLVFTRVHKLETKLIS